MKNILKNFLLFLLLAGWFSSCDDILDTKSGQFLTVDDNTLDSANDSVYSMMGILKQVRGLSERIVLLGELRGDLTTTTDYADLYLQKINNFEQDASDVSSNQWLSVREYYKLINSCNYFIKNMDTSSVAINGSSVEKVMLPEFVQAKTIRAWTYLQMLTIYGKATYLTQPILSIDDARKEYPLKGMDEIMDSLIIDLEPWVGFRSPNYGNVGNFDSKYFFFPTEFVLGDLYLWRNEYAKAAEMYYSLMYNKSLTITSTYQSILTNATDRTINHKWSNLFGGLSGEVLSLFPFESSTTGISNLYKLAYTNYEIAPAGNYIELNNSQTYINSGLNQVTITGTGDLRGEYESYYYPSYLPATGTITNSNLPVIKKYSYLSGTVVYAYRTSILYLRYAEALNELGKPAMALAVLNAGLNSETINPNNQIIPKSELTSGESWLQFSDSRFVRNIGTRQRGLGISTANYLKFEAGETDSVGFVEKAIRTELALETAFEGHRFPDLMRIARHRANPDFLAYVISLKHGANAAAIRSKLQNPENWFMPYPKK